MLAALAAALGAGCGTSGGDRAGGAPAPKPRVLTLANEFADSGELDGFAHEVQRLSHGTMRIEVKNWPRRGQAAPEPGLINDVRARRADLGAAPSRSFDSVDVTSFRALQAPLLIDSYALQERVVQSALVDDMLRGLTPLGLAGVGVLPGPMRKPLGITRALVEPADYRDLTIGIQKSSVADATMRALGATPAPFPIGGTIARFDGIEMQVPAIQGNRYGQVGRYLTANLDLWPRPLVVFANRATFDGLTSEQQDILGHAVTNVAPAETARLRRDERDAAGFLCRAGEQFISASPQDVAALRGSVQPVYDELLHDPDTATFIAKIEQLRDPAASASDRLSCTNTESTATPRTPLDGVYRVTTTIKRDGRHESDPVPENYGAWTYVFARGRFAITQENKPACTWAYGTFKVTGDHFSWTFTDGGGITPNNATNKPGEFFVFGWSLYHDTLTLTPVKGQISPTNFRLRPWRRIATTPSPRYLSKRCPPPAAGLPR